MLVSPAAPLFAEAILALLGLFHARLDRLLRNSSTLAAAFEWEMPSLRLLSAVCTTCPDVPVLLDVPKAPTTLLSPLLAELKLLTRRNIDVDDVTEDPSTRVVKLASTSLELSPF